MECLHESADQVVDLINKSAHPFLLEPESAPCLYLLARDHKKLHLLHSIYRAVAPSTSTLKNRYHPGNLKSAMKKDFAIYWQLETLAISYYATYLANLGERFVLVDRPSYSRADLLACIHALLQEGRFEWTLSNTDLHNYRQASIKCLRSIHLKSIGQDDDGNFCILFQESITHFYSDVKNEGLNTPVHQTTGQELADSLQLKKIKIITGLHKMILSASENLRIFLIDPQALNGRTSAFHRALACLREINARLKGISPATVEDIRPVAPSLDQVLATSSTRNGHPGGGHLINSSPHALRVLFSTEPKGAANFLRPVLNNASW